MQYSTLAKTQDLTLDRVCSVLGLSLVNLIRGTLSIEANSLNRMELTLHLQKDWVDARWLDLEQVPLLKKRIQAISLVRYSEVSVSKTDGSYQILLQFDLPVESSIILLD